MSWAVWSVDTITGGDKEQIQVADFPWERLLSAGGTGKVKLQLDDLDYSPSDLDALTAEWARTFVLDWDGGVEFAGIVRNQVYDDDAGTLELELIDLWGMWARRGAYDQNVPNIELWSITYPSMTLGTLAKRAVQRGTTGPVSPSLLLPVTLPADMAGSLSRTYNGYQIDYVGDVLDDLMAEGLDIDFRPRWLSGALDWQMLNDPNTGSHEWAVGAPESGLSGFRERRDGSRMTNNSRVVGAGSGRKMLVRSNRDPASALPQLDRVEFRKNISDPLQAYAIADNNLDLYAQATSSWEFKVAASGTPGVSALKLGDTARFMFSDHRRFGTGIQNRRIVKLSGSLGESVTVGCHPTGGA